MRCRCGRFSKLAWCQTCWDRQIRSLRTRIHAATERAGLCDHVRCWWWT